MCMGVCTNVTFMHIFSCPPPPTIPPSFLPSPLPLLLPLSFFPSPSVYSPLSLLPLLLLLLLLSLIFLLLLSLLLILILLLIHLHIKSPPPPLTLIGNVSAVADVSSFGSFLLADITHGADHQLQELGEIEIRYDA